MVNIYHHKNHPVKVRDDSVVVKVKGSETYQSGEYTNERNVTLEIELNHEQILEAAEKIKEQQ